MTVTAFAHRLLCLANLVRFDFVVRQAKKEPDAQKAAKLGDFSRRYTDITQFTLLTVNTSASLTLAKLNFNLTSSN